MGRAATRARHGCYIFKRGAVWWYRFQCGPRRIERSLHTTDKAIAEIRVLPLIAAYKATLQERKPHYADVPRLADGGYPQPDGSVIVASGLKLIRMKDNVIIGEELNTERKLVGSVGDLYRLAQGALLLKADPEAARSRLLAVPKVAAEDLKDPDDKLIEAYLDHGGKKRAGIHGFAKKEAESVWLTFKTLSAGKALKSCTPDDGRRLAAHFFDLGNSSGTVRKKVNWLNAAVNLAIREGQFTTINPFAGVVAMKDDKIDRQPFDPDEIWAILASLGTLPEPDQLLIRLLATTGMRCKEAIAIKSEEPPEHGVRFVIIGKGKSESSKRRVPLPADLLPFLPTVIKGPLFKGDADYASKRLMKYLRSIGITDPRKVAYSFRHRAKDRLRSFECPEKIAEAIFGRDEVTVGDGYGKGFPVPVLKKWADLIGFAA
jgi:integrase